MIRSMSTAVTGLRGHQQKLDVIGNNIANVNTVAFKKSQARFEDLLSQTIQGATAPLTRGDINPSQVGMGMRVSSIVDIHSQGAITNTDRPTDLAIEGEGFFVVNDGRQNYYTRDGSFSRDANGDLVNVNGLRVMGYRYIDGVKQDDAIQHMNIPLGVGDIARASQNLGFAGNLDARSYRAATTTVLTGTVAFADDEAVENVDDTLDFDISINGVPYTFSHELSAGNIETKAGLLAAINGDLFGSGVTADWDSTGDRLVLTADNPGATAISFTGDDHAGLFGSNYSYTAGQDTVAETYTYEYYVYDSLGRRYAVDYTFIPEGNNTWNYSLTVSDMAGTLQQVTQGSPGQLRYDQWGNFDPSVVIPDLEFTPTDPLAAPLRIAQDFNVSTQLANTNSLLIRRQDGYAPGELVAFSIGRTGVIIGAYSNGMIMELGQVVMGFFSNPEGLTKEGGNLYMETANSGRAEIGDPGDGGRGLISSSSLEMSNTDLAFEFTELITTSRAFQANTRVVTTSDEVLVEVINMKR